MNNASFKFKKPLVHSNKVIAGLFAKLEQHNRLLNIVKTSLPKPLAEQIVQCVVNSNKLLIYTTAASWASQVRFYHSVILKSVAPETPYRIDMLQVRICQPIPVMHEKQEHRAKIPKPETIKALSEFIADDDDDPLSKAILNLSSTLMRLSQ